MVHQHGDIGISQLIQDQRDRPQLKIARGTGDRTLQQFQCVHAVPGRQGRQVLGEDIIPLRPGVHLLEEPGEPATMLSLCPQERVLRIPDHAVDGCLNG